MSKYISVLNSDLNKSYHVAIQWGDTLQSIRSNPYYSAGVNMNIPKNGGDERLETKTVVEKATLAKGKATIIKLSVDTINSVKLASSKASKGFIATIKN